MRKQQTDTIPGIAITMNLDSRTYDSMKTGILCPFSKKMQSYETLKSSKHKNWTIL
jgi:hypothetical protein